MQKLGNWLKVQQDIDPQAYLIDVVLHFADLQQLVPIID